MLDATVLNRSRTTHYTTNNWLSGINNDQAVAFIPKGMESRLIRVAILVTLSDNQEINSEHRPYNLYSDEKMPSKMTTSEYMTVCVLIRNATPVSLKKYLM